MFPRIVLVLALAAVGIAGAQATPPALTGIAALDRANAARATWRTAIAAERRGDLAAAHASAARAAHGWPEQPAFVWGWAVLSARTGDSAAVRDALRDYAAMGLGRDLSDTTFDRYRALPWFGETDSMHRRNRAVLAKSTVRATLSDSTLWPEGMDYDPATRRFYVTSIRHGTVVEVAPNGTERDVWPRGASGIGAVFAVRVDPRRGVLWATTSGGPMMARYQPSDSGLAALLEVRINDGAVLRRFDLPRDRSHVLGDVAIAPNGDVYFSDSNNPVLYRLRRGSDTLESITHPLFRSLQGIAPEGDDVVYLADYSHGLLRVRFDSRDVARLAAPAIATTLGCDGIAWHAASHSIIAVQNGVAPARIVRFRVDASGTRVESAETIDRHWDIADEPTIGTLIGDEFVYVANSQWEKHRDDGTRIPDRALTAPVLLSVRVPAELRLVSFPSKVFANTRTLRVLLPRGYDAPENRNRRYPVLYLNDGQNLFDSTTATLNPQEWRVDETVDSMIAAGTLPPLIVVGIDNAGRRGRFREYFPWVDEFLQPPEPDPRGRDYPAFLVEEVVPFIESRFRVMPGAAHRALGGSSAGALAALYAVAKRPGVFGGLLVESPSLYVDDYHILRELRARSLPQRFFLGVGTNESNRDACDSAAAQGQLVSDVQRLSATLRQAGVRASNIRLVVTPCGRHDERAWAARLPSALEFLFPRQRVP
jgi:predicted alpha/beta superfamily hydrolase/sugar lactone lactonase YvrE